MQTTRNEITTLPISYSNKSLIVLALCNGQDWAWVKNLALTNFEVHGSSRAFWFSIGF